MSLSYEKCTLCARRCAVNRGEKLGFCKMSDRLFVARASLHAWEEPIISGTRGSGTVFFSGCSLRCSYCQNAEISRGESGIEISARRLSEIMLELQAKGAHNINLVTPTHYAPTIADAVATARGMGLTLPIVYNTSSYDTVETLRCLEGTVDVYLADLKYYRENTALELSCAADYPKVARLAIEEMVRQKGAPVLNNDGILERGVIVRILLLPSHLAEAKLSLKYLLDTYGDGIYISLMNQYTPMPGMSPPLDRPVSRGEYRELLDYAERLGLKNGFTQDFGTAEESFIPPFDNSGVLA